MPAKRWLRNTTIMAAIVGAWTIAIRTTRADADTSLTMIPDGRPATNATTIVVAIGRAKAMTKYRKREFFLRSRSIIDLNFAIALGGDKNYTPHVSSEAASGFTLLIDVFYGRCWPF